MSEQLAIAPHLANALKYRHGHWEWFKMKAIDVRLALHDGDHQVISGVVAMACFNFDGKPHLVLADRQGRNGEYEPCYVGIVGVDFLDRETEAPYRAPIPFPTGDVVQAAIARQIQERKQLARR